MSIDGTQGNDEPVIMDLAARAKARGRLETGGCTPGPLHIVLVNQWYPLTGNRGGTAVYAYNLAHAYADLGHTVSIVTAGRVAVMPDGAITVHHVRPVTEPSWSRRIPFLGRYFRTFRHVLYSWRVSRYLERLDEMTRIDVVEFPEVNGEALAYVLANPRPFVIIRCHTPHALLKTSFSSVERTFDFDLIARLERVAIRRADSVTVPSEDLRARIADLCGVSPHRITVLAHPVPLPHLSLHEPAQECRSVRVLHVGRLHRSKGVFTLARAIPLALKEIPNLRVTFVGKSGFTPAGEPVDAVLQRMLDEAGCLDHVEFPGYLDQGQVEDEYFRADICVVPSEMYESFSFSCAQAMAAAKPVIASRIGGIPEVVIDGWCGLLVAPGDAVSLADSIVQLARDPVLRRQMGERGRMRVEELYDPARIGRKNLRHLQNLGVGRTE